jgi:hypothetical protein
MAIFIFTINVTTFYSNNLLIGEKLIFIKVDPFWTDLRKGEKSILRAFARTQAKIICLFLICSDLAPAIFFSA